MSVAGEQRPCTMDLLSHVTPRPLLGEAQAQPPLSLTVIKVCTAFPYRYSICDFQGKTGLELLFGTKQETSTSDIT